MERLEEIRERQDFCRRPERKDVAHISQDQADWLIAEVTRLRAELAEWKGNYQTLLDGTSDHISRLNEALGRVVEALVEAKATIAILHGSEGWAIYELNSPEMKQTNEALAFAKGLMGE